jgi:hypothetical protein
MQFRYEIVEPFFLLKKNILSITFYNARCLPVPFP